MVSKSLIFVLLATFPSAILAADNAGESKAAIQIVDEKTTTAPRQDVLTVDGAVREAILHVRESLPLLRETSRSKSRNDYDQRAVA